MAWGSQIVSKIFFLTPTKGFPEVSHNRELITRIKTAITDQLDLNNNDRFNSAAAFLSQDQCPAAFGSAWLHYLFIFFCPRRHQHKQRARDFSEFISNSFFFCSFWTEHKVRVVQFLATVLCWQLSAVKDDLKMFLRFKGKNSYLFRLFHHKIGPSVGKRLDLGLLPMTLHRPDPPRFI